jgi:molecular chaperone GrpE
MCEKIKKKSFGGAHFANIDSNGRGNLNSSNYLGDFNDKIKKCNYIVKNKYDDLKLKYTKLKIELNNRMVVIEDSHNEKLRLHADMENTRMRSRKEVANAQKFALSPFINELLPVLDSMEKGIAACETSKDIVAIIKGTELTLQMLIDILKKFNIRQIDPKNDYFDPNKHEAMAMQADNTMEDNQILSVFQKGYELNDRIIRPARVLVVKNS